MTARRTCARTHRPLMTFPRSFLGISHVDHRAETTRYSHGADDLAFPASNTDRSGPTPVHHPKRANEQLQGPTTHPLSRGSGTRLNPIGSCAASRHTDGRQPQSPRDREPRHPGGTGTAVRRCSARVVCMVRLLGLTGPIACGKSTVSERLAAGGGVWDGRGAGGVGGRSRVLRRLRCWPTSYSMILHYKTRVRVAHDS